MKSKRNVNQMSERRPITNTIKCHRIARKIFHKTGAIIEENLSKETVIHF